MKIKELIKLNQEQGSDIGKEIQKLENRISQIKQEMITLKDLEQITGITKMTLISYRKAGLIPFYRSTKIYFFKSEALAAIAKIPKRRIGMPSKRFV